MEMWGLQQNSKQNQLASRQLSVCHMPVQEEWREQNTIIGT